MKYTKRYIMIKKANKLVIEFSPPPPHSEINAHHQI